jgi:hypothetical protein
MRHTVLSDLEDHLNTSSRPAWARLARLEPDHPQRSIDGGMVWGRVWRRHDGRRWIYERLARDD